MNYYNEHDKNAAKWLRGLIKEGLIPNGHVDERSITDVRPHEIEQYAQQHFFAGIGGWSLALRLAGWPEDKPVRTGSCPCQPFSSAGSRRGEKDERHLWPIFRDIITFGEPAITFGEQVASKDGLEWLSRVRADLEGIGYEVGAADLPASIHSPHQRQRIYWVANPASKRGRSWIKMDNGHRQEPRGSNPNLCFEQRLDGRGCRSTLGIADILSPPNGVSGRVGLLRGYGNAIVPQVAAEFIKAFIEALK